MLEYSKYLVKTLLYGVVPGGLGHYRGLRHHKNIQYNHERDKHPVRVRHNTTQGWQQATSSSLHATTSIQKRNYTTYDEYLTHQSQKYHEIIQMFGGFPNRVIFTWRQRFYRRFRHLSRLLPKSAIILCLGARQGTEVEVLRDLGFTQAYGIDLNPGPGNPYVIKGDFMHLAEASESIDLIYTNSLDHAFDLDSFLAEQTRVLKPGGFALYDLPRYSGTRHPGAFEAIGWNSEAAIISRLKQSFQKVVHSEQEKKWQWVLLQGPLRQKS